MLPRFASALITVFAMPCLNAADGTTSLLDDSIRYRVPTANHVHLARGDVTVIIVNNAAVNVPQLPNHRAGYNGVASLTHRSQPNNLFVPTYAGLNFEHIHDGTVAGLVEKFEPRKFAMQLRVVDQHTVELYQPPTGNFALESCGRYQLLDDGVIEYTFECIVREQRFRKHFVGLFWASYINQPTDKSIYFWGRPAGTATAETLIKAMTPRHGIDSTHRPAGTIHLPAIEADFPLSLVNHPSRYEYSRPWYYGVSQGMALVQMFRSEDRVWFAQSPTGGGDGNPAWDFQWFIADPVVGRLYRFVMRAAYLPFVSDQQIQRFVSEHSFE